MLEKVFVCFARLLMQGMRAATENLRTAGERSILSIKRLTKSLSSKILFFRPCKMASQQLLGNTGIKTYTFIILPLKIITKLLVKCVKF